MGKIITTELFIKESKKIHGDKYDYSLVDYKKAKEKVKIICQKHGIFEQTPNKHKLGCGCPLCANNIRYETKDFIEKALIVHNNKYDYSKVRYINRDNKVEIGCKIHGYFFQNPYEHINGKGCQKCGYDTSRDKQQLDRDIFIERAIIIHDKKYDYSNIKYNNLHDNINIICKKHGIFQQSAKKHLEGQGCRKCSYQGTSKLELGVSNWISKYVEININNRNLINKELDIYIPSKRVAIEINGLYWHSEKFIDKNYHLDKFDLCKEKNIQLIQLFEDTIIKKPDLVKSFLKSKLGIFEEKINARECEIRNVETKISNDFLDKNHLQGIVSATNYLGLFYKEELVSLLLLKKINDKIYDLNRFCSKQNYLVRGGFSKLLKHFTKINKNVEEIITFSDNTYSDGGLYLKNGFEKIKNLPPDYKYLYKGELKHKFGFRLNNLKKLFPYDNGSERDITLKNNIFRVYDSGKQKFRLNLNNI